MTFKVGNFVPRYEKNVSLARFSTMRVGGVANYVFFPRTESEVFAVIQALRGESYRFIGNGSNVLFAEGTLATPLIYTGNLREITLTSTGIFAGAGVPLPLLYARAKALGFTGCEFFSGIPGTVGGGVVMNAGAFGKSLSDVLVSVRTVNGEIPTCECGFSYRNSCFVSQGIPVLGATFTFPSGDKGDSEKRERRYREIRITSQPLHLPSLGSVFQSVNGCSAWQFVDGAGMRGAAIGGAMVSEKHANFIVNTGNATAMDVYRLIQTVKKRVFDVYGILLKEEIHYIGEFYDTDC